MYIDIEMDDVVTKTTNLRVSDASFETASTPMSSSLSSEGGSNYFKWIGYFLILVILSILGFNLFDYLGNIIQWFADTFGPMVKKVANSLGMAVGDTTKTTLNQSAEGAKGGISAAAGTITSGITLLQQTLSGKPINKENAQQKSLGPVADDSGSRVQKTASKSGYCYIGEDRGFRNCISVNEGDKCMSGNIFPTMDVCINPTIRK